MTWQPAPVLYPDVEMVLTGAVRPLLSGVHVGRKIPNPRSAKMVIFTRDGGGSASLRDAARVRCRVWAPTDLEAANLSRQVVSLLPTLVDGDPILRVVHLSGPYEVADETGTPQRYLLFEIHTRGETP